MVSRTHTAAFGLMMAATLLTAGLAAGQDAALPRTIVLRVHDYARLPPDTMALARERASRVFESAGVSLVWVARGAAPPAGEVRELTVVLLSAEMGERKTTAEGIGDRVLARSERMSGRAYVLSHRVAKVAAGYRRPLGDVLGTVIAHEVGHLLLPPRWHSRTGIMGANLDPHLRSDAEAAFTTEETRVIQLRLALANGHGQLGSEEHRPILIDRSPLH
jgi:hypothetical protein